MKDMIRSYLLSALLLISSAALDGADHGAWIPIRVQSLRYPILGVQARMEGEVLLRIRIDARGRVDQVNVRSGPAVLAKAAQENITLWRFQLLGGIRNAAGTEIEFTYLFKLEESPMLTEPPTDFIYDYPGTVTVISRPQHWIP
jgi:TonB family protein